MEILDSEPNWETQDMVQIYFKDSQTCWERFSDSNGNIYVHISVEEPIKCSGWLTMDADEWNEHVDDSEEAYGTDLYL